MSVIMKVVIDLMDACFLAVAIWSLIQGVCALWDKKLKTGCFVLSCSLLLIKSVLFCGRP